MSDIAATLRHAAGQLEAVSDTPRLDAELLMAHALDMERGAMLLSAMRNPAPAIFGPLLLRRLAHEPVAYITGMAEFWSLPLQVTPDVLIPRGDSETLIVAAQQYFARPAPGRILDLGTGSGALILAALSEWPQAKGVAMDASEAALAVANSNAEALDMAGRCRFLHQSWSDKEWQNIILDADPQGFDLILCNPPYVEADADLAPQVRDYEPAEALFAGPGGMEDYLQLIPAVKPLLSDSGIAIFEIGASQAEAVSAIAANSGWHTRLHHDLADRPRALSFPSDGHSYCL